VKPFRALALVALVLATGLGGCGGSEGEEGSGCLARLIWEGREYVGSGTRLPPERGQSLGEATMPGCGSGDDITTAIAHVEGVNPEAALAVPEDPTTIYLGPRYAHASDTEFPPPLARIILGPFCSESGPFVVEGELSSSDLVDAFQFHVEKTEPSELPYTGLLLDIRRNDATEGINPQDEFSDFDRFRVEVRCVHAKLPTRSYLAERVTFLANGPYCGKNGLPCHDPETGEPRPGSG
jgi:hypothetical protein